MTRCLNGCMFSLEIVLNTPSLMFNSSRLKVLSVMWRFRWRSLYLISFLLIQSALLYIEVDWKRHISYVDFNHRGSYLKNVSHEKINKRQLFPRFSLNDVDPHWTDKVVVAGPGKLNPKRYLTVGFVTAKRPRNTTYLFKTLNSLMTNADDSDRKEICILILMAENDGKWKTDVLNKINQTYPDAISTGTIQILQTFNWMYPKLYNLTHHRPWHSKLKVSWKAKQNIDFTLLWLFVKNLDLSHYYIHLEDDVITVKNYFKIIRIFISRLSRRWACLEFSWLGMIAKLYHTYDLEILAQVVALFYEEQPADNTYIYLNSLMFQTRRIVRKPTIFQHIGWTSSLRTKTSKISDIFFLGNFTKRYKGDNPPADIITTISDETASPEVAYLSDMGFYWSAKRALQGEYYRVKFKRPESVRRIVVVSGKDKFPKDIFHNAVLEVSYTLNKTNHCLDYKTLGTFSNGLIDINNITESSGTQKMHCFQIRVLKTQSPWILIQEIAVFLWH